MLQICGAKYMYFLLVCGLISVTIIHGKYSYGTCTDGKWSLFWGGSNSQVVTKSLYTTR